MKRSVYLTVTLLLTAGFLAACNNPSNSTTNSTSSSSTSTTMSSDSSNSSATDSSSTSSSTTDTISSSSTDISQLLDSTDTGVTLESGQKTIDYANEILGDKDWNAMESNYGRTESVPFELLQGNDNSLYRVYQNGVITDEDDNLIYQPNS